MNKEGKKKKIEQTRLHSTTQGHTLHWKNIYQPKSDQYLIQISNHKVITISIKKKKKKEERALTFGANWEKLPTNPLNDQRKRSINDLCFPTKPKKKKKKREREREKTVTLQIQLTFWEILISLPCFRVCIVFTVFVRRKFWYNLDFGLSLYDSIYSLYYTKPNTILLLHTEIIILLLMGNDWILKTTSFWIWNY